MAHRAAGKAANKSLMTRVFMNTFAGIGALTTLAGAYFSFKTMRYSQTQRQEVEHQNLESLRMTAQHFHDTFRPNQDDSALFASDTKEAYLDYLRVCQQEFSSKQLARTQFMTRFINESAIIPPESSYLPQHPPPSDGEGNISPSSSSSSTSTASADAPVWTPGTSVFQRASDGALVAVDTVYKLREAPDGEKVLRRDMNDLYVDSLTQQGKDGVASAVAGAGGDGKDVHDVYGMVSGTGGMVWVPVAVQVERLQRTGDIAVTMDTDLPHGLSYRQFRSL